MSDHAEYPPSSLGLMEACPGWRNRNTETEAAAKGTRIHEALEKDTIDQLDEEERPLARKCSDFIEALILDRLPVLPDSDHREIRMTMDLGDGLSTFGTCDRLLVYGDFGYMLDYKSGYRHITDASENAQAFAYVIGAFQKFPALNTIEFYFLIPNRDEISYHTFQRSDLPAMQLRLNTIIRRAMAADPKLFNPGPERCEYCARQADCPVLAKKALSISAEIADGLPVPDSIIVDKARPEDIPHLLRLAPLMEAWAAGVKEAALKLSLEEGLEIPGYARQERKLPRAITSVFGAWQVAKEHGVTFEEFLETCSKASVPKLLAAVSAKAKRGQKNNEAVKFENNLRHHDVLREEGSIFYLRETKK